MSTITPPRKIEQIAKAVAETRWKPGYTEKVKEAKDLLINEAVLVQKQHLLQKGYKILSIEDIPAEMRPFVLVYKRLIVPGHFLENIGVANFFLRRDLHQQSLPQEAQGLCLREDAEEYLAGTVVLKPENFSENTRNVILECQSISEQWEAQVYQLKKELSGFISVASLLEAAPTLKYFFTSKDFMKHPSLDSSEGLSSQSLEAIATFETSLKVT